MKIRVLSMWQPWASLVITGHKKIETRGYNTPYRGLFLIHAALYPKCIDKVRDMPYYKPCIEAIGGADNLPLGKIIGLAVLQATLRTEVIIHHANKISNGITPKVNPLHNCDVTYWDKELCFGLYGADRFGWLLKDAKVFQQPIPHRGSQNFASITLTDEMEAQIKIVLPQYHKYLPLELI